MAQSAAMKFIVAADKFVKQMHAQCRRLTESQIQDARHHVVACHSQEYLPAVVGVEKGKVVPFMGVHGPMSAHKVIEAEFSAPLPRYDSGPCPKVVSMADEPIDHDVRRIMLNEELHVRVGGQYTAEELVR